LEGTGWRGVRRGLVIEGRWCTTPSQETSSRPASTALPPATWLVLANHSRRDLDVPQVAELPELLGRSRVLEDDLIDFERVELSCPEAFERQVNVTNELSELLLVISRHLLASCPAFGLGGHEPTLARCDCIDTRGGITAPTAVTSGLRRCPATRQMRRFGTAAQIVPGNDFQGFCSRGAFKSFPGTITSASRSAFDRARLSA